MRQVKTENPQIDQNSKFKVKRIKGIYAYIDQANLHKLLQKFQTYPINNKEGYNKLTS